MNQEIIPELRFFLASIALGLLFALAYDVLRIFRRILKQNLLAVSAEDFLFWLFAGLMGFRVIYVYNYGIVRWYALFGMVSGALFYYGTISSFFVGFCTKFLLFFIKPVRKGLKKIRNVVKIRKERAEQKRAGRRRVREENAKKKQKEKEDRL